MKIEIEYLQYKGKGNQSVNELEKIIEQREEELHLIKSGDVVKNNDLLHNVSYRRELLLSAICQFTNRNTQKEILEVDDWLKTDYRK